MMIIPRIAPVLKLMLIEFDIDYPPLIVSKTWCPTSISVKSWVPDYSALEEFYQYTLKHMMICKNLTLALSKSMNK